MHCMKQSLSFFASDLPSLSCLLPSRILTLLQTQHNTHNTQLISLIRSRDLITHLLLWVALCSFALVLFFLLILLVCFSLSCDSVSGRSHYAEARIILILRHHSSFQLPQCQLKAGVEVDPGKARRVCAPTGRHTCRRTRDREEHQRTKEIEDTNEEDSEKHSSDRGKTLRRTTRRAREQAES